MLQLQPRHTLSDFGYMNIYYTLAIKNISGNIMVLHMLLMFLALLIYNT